VTPAATSRDSAFDASRPDPAALPSASEADPAADAAAAAETEEVFKRVFWRRPSPKDRIIHAKLNEWLASDGVERWQWFIVVDPSEELFTYLTEQNPFALVEPPADKINQPKGDVPDWFPKDLDNFKIQQTNMPIRAEQRMQKSEKGCMTRRQRSLRKWKCEEGRKSAR